MLQCRLGLSHVGCETANLEGNVVVPRGACRVNVRMGTNAGIFWVKVSVETGGRLQAEGEGAAQGVRLGFHSSDSSRGGEGGDFTRGGAVGMDPKGGLSQHLRGEQCFAPNKNKTKNSKNKTQKHTPKMMLIGRLGGPASSGENHWVEGAEGRGQSRAGR